MTLNEIDRRVLGVLLEKAMSQPEYYPMTLNAIVAASNQKQNREPVMSLDPVAVEGSLTSLQEQNLVTMLLPGQGARVKRYRHEVENVFGWQKADRAIMAELLLRGPQTPGELKSRCARFLAFADLDAVTEALEALCRRDPPMAASLSRAPGQSATRYDHLLYPTAEQPAAVSDTPAGPPQVAPDVAGQVEELRQNVQHLQRRLTELEGRVATLDRQVNPS